MSSRLLPFDTLPFVRTISGDEWMARGTTPEGYFQRGYNALGILVQEIERAGVRPARILDFGCGHDGVARMLRTQYPQSTIVGQDVSRDWLDWCETHLAIETVQSPDRIVGIRLEPDTYDVIWAGSVFTHIPEQSFDHLLNQVLAALTPGGVTIFITAGHRIRAGFTPGKEPFLDLTAAETALIDHDRDGYGFAPYVNGRYPDWGRALTGFPKVFDKLRAAGGRLISFQDGGWGRRQDVYAAVRG